MVSSSGCKLKLRDSLKGPLRGEVFFNGEEGADGYFWYLQIDLEVVSFIGNLKGCMGQKRLKHARLPSVTPFISASLCCSLLRGRNRWFQDDAPWLSCEVRSDHLN